MIRKGNQKAAKWNQKEGKLEPKWREKGRQVAVAIKIAFGSNFGSHFGDLGGANGQPMRAKHSQKSRKIASSYNSLKFRQQDTN